MTGGMDLSDGSDVEGDVELDENALLQSDEEEEVRVASRTSRKQRGFSRDDARNREQDGDVLDLQLQEDDVIDEPDGCPPSRSNVAPVHVRSTANGNTPHTGPNVDSYQHHIPESYEGYDHDDDEGHDYDNDDEDEDDEDSRNTRSRFHSERMTDNLNTRSQFGGVGNPIQSLGRGKAPQVPDANRQNNWPRTQGPGYGNHGSRPPRFRGRFPQPHFNMNRPHGPHLQRHRPGFRQQFPPPNPHLPQPFGLREQFPGPSFPGPPGRMTGPMMDLPPQGQFSPRNPQFQVRGQPFPHPAFRPGPRGPPAQQQFPHPRPDQWNNQPPPSGPPQFQMPGPPSNPGGPPQFQFSGPPSNPGGSFNAPLGQPNHNVPSHNMFPQDGGPPPFMNPGIRSDFPDMPQYSPYQGDQPPHQGPPRNQGPPHDMMGGFTGGPSIPGNMPGAVPALGQQTAYIHPTPASQFLPQQPGGGWPEYPSQTAPTSWNHPPTAFPAAVAPHFHPNFTGLQSAEYRAVDAYLSSSERGYNDERIHRVESQESQRPSRDRDEYDDYQKDARDNRSHRSRDYSPERDSRDTYTHSRKDSERSDRRYHEERDRESSHRYSDRYQPKRKLGDELRGSPGKSPKTVPPPPKDEKTEELIKIREEAKKKMGLDDEYIRKLEQQQKLREEILRKKAASRKGVKIEVGDTSSNPVAKPEPSAIKKLDNGARPSIYINPKAFKCDMSGLTVKPSDHLGSSSSGVVKPRKVLKIVKDKHGNIISKKVILCHKLPEPTPS